MWYPYFAQSRLKAPGLASATDFRSTTVVAPSNCAVRSRRALHNRPVALSFQTTATSDRPWLVKRRLAVPDAATASPTPRQVSMSAWDTISRPAWAASKSATIALYLLVARGDWYGLPLSSH